MEKPHSSATIPSVPWSVPVAVENISDHGLHMEIEASAAVRAQVLALVAGLATVHDLPKLSAVFDLTRRGAKVHVTGHVSARVAQTCVVTLEPIESDVEEAVDVLFAPVAPDAPQPETVAYDSNADSEQEPPEPLVDGTVDVGALATEFLVLGINPHPRKAGAEFAPVRVGNDEAKPFAALEALKNRLGGGNK
ncbi:MAG TPA: DUF177 domain-containing protein [Pseudolabrys sp.]